MPMDSPSVTECIPAEPANVNPVTPEQSHVPDQVNTPASATPSTSQARSPSMDCPYVVESFPAENGRSTTMVFAIQALGIRWRHTYRNILLGSEWMDLDPKHIPWQVIAGNKPLQGFTLSEINHQINPPNKAMPYDVARRKRRNTRMGDLTLPPEDPGTYAEIRIDINGNSRVYVFFGDTNEQVTIDIDVLFLDTDIGYRIQAIIRHSQRRGQPLIVPEPDEDIDDQMDAWSNMG